MLTFDHIQDERKNNLRKNVAGILAPLVKNHAVKPLQHSQPENSYFATLLHVININKTGNARINVTMRRVRATIVALEK